MRTSIALLALLLAAALRPSPSLPEVRRPAPAAVQVLPAETAPDPSPRPGFFEAVAGALLPREEAEPPLIGEILRLPHGVDDAWSTQADELERLGDDEALRAELRRAFNTGYYRRAEGLAGRLREGATWGRRIQEARGERMAHLTHARRPLEIDSDVLNDLTPQEWDELVPVLLRDARGVEGYPTVEAVRRVLDTHRYDFAFESATLEQILEYARDMTGLNILLEAAVRDRIDPDLRTTFKVQDLLLRDSLTLLLTPFSLTYQVTAERAVLITGGRRPS